MRMLLALFVFMLAGPLMAQDLLPVEEGIIVPPVIDPSALGTISGIVAATLLLVEIIKRAGQNLPFIRAVRVWAIAVLVSIGLTYLSNRILGTLEGDLPTLLWTAALSAASASGIHTWLRKPTEGPAQASTASN